MTQQYGVQGTPITIPSDPYPEVAPEVAVASAEVSAEAIVASGHPITSPPGAPAVASADSASSVPVDTAALIAEVDRYRALVRHWERVAETTPMHTVEGKSAVSTLFKCIDEFRKASEG